MTTGIAALLLSHMEELGVQVVDVAQRVLVLVWPLFRPGRWVGLLLSTNWCLRLEWLVPTTDVLLLLNDRLLVPISMTYLMLLPESDVAFLELLELTSDVL